MGKFPPSTIHNWFSDWHWNNCKDSAALTDVDRLWIEVRDGKPCAVFDLKWDDNPADQPTGCEYIISEWFEKHGIPYYVIRVALRERGYPETEFHVHRQMEHTCLTEIDMINWINDSLDPHFIFPRSKMEE